MIQSGDRVLFVPMIPKWSVRHYMPGIVQSTIGKFGIVIDFTGVLHTVYLASLVNISSNVDV